jgi:3-oxoacyl-[acyl-carrier protein] reductase
MLKNKNILISGVSRGLGLQITKILLESSANVYGISREKSYDIEQLLKYYPDSFHYLQYDLADVQNIKIEIFNKWIKNTLPLHGFVNNAAMAYDDIITNMNLENLNEMFNLNVFSPYMIVKYFIRKSILNRNKGSIVHISSISSHTGYKGLSMYAGSKGALESFSKNTAREWGERGIRSNCVVAGFMETSMSQSISEKIKDRIYNRTCLKEPTNLESVASTVSFLLSDTSGSITGQNIFVDSGTI